MARIADLADLGYLPLQCFEERFEVQVRPAIFGARIERREKAAGLGRYKIDDKARGDILGAHFWDTADKKSRKVGAFYFATPVVLAAGNGDEPNGNPGTQQHPQGQTGRPAKNPLSTIPVKDRDWTADGRFSALQPGLPSYSQRFPKGWGGTVLGATDERSQSEVMSPGFFGLIAVNNGGNPDEASLVSDLKDAGEIDEDRQARLHSAWRVVQQQDGLIPLRPQTRRPNALSWQLGRAGKDDVPGMGFVTDAAQAAPAQKTGISTTNGGAKGLTHALATYKAYGPLDVGDTADKHHISQDADGNPINALHLFTGVPWHGGAGDAPMLFEGLWEPPTGGPILYRTHLRYNNEPEHPFIGGTRKGYWMWETEGVVAVPPENPPPENPPPPWQPEWPPPITDGPHDGPVGGPGGPGGGGPPPPPPPPNGSPPPRTTPPRGGKVTAPPIGPPEPQSPHDGPVGGSGAAPAAGGLAPHDDAPEPTTARPEGYWDHLKRQAGPTRRTRLLPVPANVPAQAPAFDGPNTQPLTGDPGATPAAGNPFRFEPGAVFSLPITSRGESASSEAYADSSLQLALPAILYKPQDFFGSMPDLRASRKPSRGELARRYALAPVTLRQEAWFGSTGYDGVTYTQKPGEGRYSGGTATGGVSFMPPETSLVEIFEGKVPASLSTVRVNFYKALRTLGTPLRAGKVGSGYQESISADGTHYLLNHLAADGSVESPAALDIDSGLGAVSAFGTPIGGAVSQWQDDGTYIKPTAALTTRCIKSTSGCITSTTQTNSESFGEGAGTSSTGSTAVGKNASTGLNGVAIGYGSNGTGNSAVAIGQGAIASATSATALGQGSTANAASATALGQGTTASGIGSLAGGAGASATAADAIALGDPATCGGNRSIVIGGAAALITSAANAIGIGADVKCGTSSVAIGDTASCTEGVGKTRNVAIGASSSATAADGVAVGNLSSVGDSSVALGSSAGSTAASAVSIGASSTAGAHGVAIGKSAFTSASGAIAIGEGAGTDPSAPSSIALGKSAYTNTGNRFVAGSSTDWIKDIFFGYGSAEIAPLGSSIPYTFKNTPMTGTDVSGSDIGVEPGLGTGASTPAEFPVYIGVPTTSGTTRQVSSKRFRVGDASSSFLDRTGNVVALFDTVNRRLGLGITPTVPLDVNGDALIRGLLNAPNGLDLGSAGLIRVSDLSVADSPINTATPAVWLAVVLPDGSQGFAPIYQ